MGADPSKLLKKYGVEPGIDQVVASTCQAVRNAAVKHLAKQNAAGWLIKNQTPFSAELQNLCFGSGFSMWEGKIVGTGACGAKISVNDTKLKYSDN